MCAPAVIPPPRARTSPGAATNASNVAPVDPAGMTAEPGTSTPAPPPDDRDTARSASAGTAAAWEPPPRHSTRCTAPATWAVRVDGGSVTTRPRPDGPGGSAVTDPSANSPPTDARIACSPRSSALNAKIAWSAAGGISTGPPMRTAAGSAARRTAAAAPPSRGPSWRTIP